jgi:urocanate reductase
MSEREAKEGLGRREFIAGTALLTGAAALIQSGVTEAMAQECTCETPKWDKEADVLIIGSGFAGLSAAIEAHDAKSSVMVLEKMPVHGGNSIVSAGSYNCVDPEGQKAQGIEDSTGLHYEQTITAGDFRGDPEKVRFLVEHALEGWKWLGSMGVELDGSIFESYGVLWPRTHRPKYKTKKQGGAIIAALNDQITARKIPVLLEHKVSRIIRQRPLEGRVLGVEVEAKGKKMFFKAKKALILASGGFCADVEMRMRHDPRLDARFATSNHPGATGEVLTLAQDIGADEIGMDYIQSSGPSASDVRFVKAPVGSVPQLKRLVTLIGMSANRCIYTDLKGKRLVASDARRDLISEAIMRTPEKVCVCITDEDGRKRAMYGEVSPEVLERTLKERPKEFFRADTVRELAVKIGMPDPNVLVETVAKYNSYVDSKSDPELGQTPRNLVWKCEKLPLWAATGSPIIHHMCGGLRTGSKTAQVLDRWGRVIPGLYAAGEVTGGVHGTNRIGGNAIPDCIVFGRVAGKHGATEEPWG